MLRVLLAVTCIAAPAGPVEENLFLDPFLSDSVASGDWITEGTGGGYSIANGALELWAPPGRFNFKVHHDYSHGTGCFVLHATATAETLYRYGVTIRDHERYVTVEFDEDGFKLSYNDLNGAWKVVRMNSLAIAGVPYDLQLTLLQGNTAIAEVDLAGVPIAAAVATDVAALPSGIDRTEIGVWTDNAFNPTSRYYTSNFAALSFSDPAACVK